MANFNFDAAGGYEACLVAFCDPSGHRVLLAGGIILEFFPLILCSITPLSFF